MPVRRRLAAILAADVVGYARLMGADEAGTLAALRAHREQLIEPRLAEHDGRVVKLMGDGLLAEFASAVQAVACAVAIQKGMAERNLGIAEARRIRLRIGINLGDVIVEGDDLLGDGVNLAARLEALAAPDAIYVSAMVHEAVEGKLDLRFEDLGAHRFKNIARPVQVFRVEVDGAGREAAARGEPAIAQEIRFCTAEDGVGIAYASVGAGPPLVKAANWLNHLEYDWESPVWRHVFRALARHHTLIRYDQRGGGLSDRRVDDISFDAFVRDLEAVVEQAKLERFALLGISQGCAISIAYAVAHPERVTRLVMYGGFARGILRRSPSPAEIAQREALYTLMEHGWGQANPAFRQIFTSLMIPDGTPEHFQWFNELERMTTTPENAARIRRACDQIDVTDLLPRVRVPTLVLHRRDDATQPFEEGRRLAGMIPGARFVPLDGRNHLILEDEPAWPDFVREVEDFLAAG